MTPTPEEAARPEEIAREILNRDANVPNPKVSEREYIYRGLNNRNYYVEHAPTLARAYLDLLAERKRTRATLETMPAPQGFDAENVLEIVDSWERNGIAQAALERFSGPMDEGRGT